ncbi:MAG: hypothetical protein RL021_2046 [Bacteroidota bacterium]
MRSKILFFTSLAVLALLAVITVNTVRSVSHRIPDLRSRSLPERDSAAVSHLQEAVHIASVTYEDSAQAGLPLMDTLIGFLERTYPEVFSTLEHERINSHSLLFRWKGSDRSLKPVLFYAHMDVVPVESGTDHGWSFDPFHAAFDADTVRGRGCIDDKAGVIGLMEAVARLVRKSFHPKRDVYIAFGHDEEIGGRNGASEIARTLRERSIKLEWLLDEGGMVAVNMVPFVDPPVALVMTSEKGYMTIEISAEGKGGHSSYPPPETPVDIINAALTRLHEHPLERKIIPSLEGFMKNTGPEMRFPFNALFANRWLFGSIILGEYEKIPEANAMIRTTFACTILQGGVKENVIPSHVKAILNIRLLPGDRSEDVFAELKKIIHDERVSMKILGRQDEATRSASLESEGYSKIKSCVRKVFPDAVVAPSISIAATDSRYFLDLADDIYRFLPVRMNRSILSGMHGTDERIGANEFMETVSFYETLISGE